MEILTDLKPEYAYLLKCCLGEIVIAICYAIIYATRSNRSRRFRETG